MNGTRIGLRPGNGSDQDWIFRLRHEVYAEELGQHDTTPAGRLRDALDDRGIAYLVATHGGEPVGFVSVTPPWAGRWSLEKYLSRADLPVPDEPGTFEIRILTVAPAWRRGAHAMLLMYGALRWVESRGGRRVVAMGRTDLGRMYRAAGLRPTGHTVTAGAVAYEVMSAGVKELAGQARRRFGPVLDRLGGTVEWRLDVPMDRPADGCAHGGASFDGIGADFRTVHRRHDVIAADVLDAWFPPAPGVLDALADDPGWLARTSPPVDADGLRAEIAAARGLPADTLALGAGSSDLIFRAFGRWLTPDSRVLLVDPAYGEYAHVTEAVVGCRVDRFPIRRADGWRTDAGRLAGTLAAGRYDLAVVVNPNNPTGGWLPATAMREVIDRTPARTRLWIDEAYVGYIGLDRSLAPLAVTTPNVVVCTSMSKMYALSGMRVAYLAGQPSTAADLRRWTPPWGVSLPAQRAGVAALRDPAYYAARWSETAGLRAGLAAELRAVDPALCVDETVANFLLVTLPREAPGAASVVAACRDQDVYLRDLSPMSAAFEGRTIRVAVREPAGNTRIVAALRKAL